VAARIYSERFLLLAVNGTWFGYTVPFGKRAIVRSILLAGNLATPCTFQLAVGSILVYNATVQAAEGGRNVDTRLVVYGGQTLQAFNASPDTCQTVSGYLFDEPLGETYEAPAAAAVAPPTGWDASALADELARAES
jgi:hypothetical protein